MANNKSGRRLPKGVAAATLGVLAVAGLAGCANPFHHSSAAAAKTAPTAKATPTQEASAEAAATLKSTVTVKADAGCVRQVAWNKQAAVSLKALYADVGALSADERAANAPGVKKAGRALVSDAVSAATLPLPPADPRDWKALIAAYATAGTALAAGGAVRAVPQLEAGGSAIAAFATAVAKCTS